MQPTKFVLVLAPCNLYCWLLPQNENQEYFGPTKLNIILTFLIPKGLIKGKNIPSSCNQQSLSWCWLPVICTVGYFHRMKTKCILAHLTKYKPAVPDSEEAHQG